MSLVDLYNAILRRLDLPSVTPQPLLVPYNPEYAQAVLVRNKEGGYNEVYLQGGKPAVGRRHVFHDVGTFAKFLKKHLPDGATVEILAGQTKVKAVDHVARVRHEIACEMPYHPDLKAWEKLFGKAYTQAQLYRALASVAHTIGKASPNAQTVLEQLQGVKVDSATASNVSLNEHGMYTVRSSDSTASLGTKLDSNISVSCPIYLDDKGERTFGVKLFIDNEDGRMRFSLAPVDLEVVAREAYVDKVAELQDLLGEAYLVALGDLAITD